MSIGNEITCAWCGRICRWAGVTTFLFAGEDVLCPKCDAKAELGFEPSDMQAPVKEPPTGKVLRLVREPIEGGGGDAA
jgi:hypothetical protein